MKTRICDLLKIEYPIVQGGMAWVAEHHLAAAVSNAGGLGIIAAGNAPAEFVREEIRKAKILTDKPFGVNIMLLSPHAPEVAKVVVEEKISVVTTGAGNPESYIPMWKEAGAEGCEAGGHIGELTTMALIPQIADAVTIPVIAAGGIGDGRGLAAVFMLGAEAGQIGTRFVVSHESIVHDNYKKRVISSKDIDSAVTGRSTGHPVRSIRNNMTRNYMKLEQEGKSFEELELLTLGSLKNAVMDGDIINGSVMAGQIAGLISKEQSCKEIIEEVVKEAEELIGNFHF